MDVRCEGLEESLPAYLYGDLPVSEREEIARHLQACPRCAESLRGFQEVRAVIDSVPVPPMPARGDLAAKVMARTRTRVRPRPIWVPLAQAALVLIGIALGIGLANLVFPDGGGEGMDMRALETLADTSGHIPDVAEVIEKQASRRYGVPRPSGKYVDELAPKLSQTKIVEVDEYFRKLVDLASGESKILAAHFQFALGDFHERRAEDPGRARGEFLKVYDFVSEGPIFERTKLRIENLLPAAPEER